MDDYDVVPSGLIELVKQRFNAGVDQAGMDIGQPTTFLVGGALNLTPKSSKREMRVARRKVEAGADFFLTQPVYDPEAARSFVERYGEELGSAAVPILVGILPLYSVRHARFLHNEVPGISIPSDIIDRLAEAGEDAPHEGVRLAVELVEQMRNWAGGIYLMPAFNRYDLAAEVVEAVRIL
jgi:homocysteine S-methyltransferase